MFSHKDYLEARRSTSFPFMGEPAPSQSDLAEILKLAARTPDHGKLFPWRFIIITPERGKDLGAKLVEILLEDDDKLDDKKREIEQKRFTRASLCVALVSTAKPHVKIPEWEQILSAGAVGMNIHHACHALGYGAVWLTEWYAYDARFKAELGLERHERIAGFFHIGRAIGKAEERPRPDMSTLVSSY